MGDNDKERLCDIRLINETVTEDEFIKHELDNNVDLDDDYSDDEINYRIEDDYKNKIHFIVGNDFNVDFVISKISFSSYYKSIK